MKILELRFKNLNSLYGEWHIDFTSPEYLSNGIFAIIGPTGAGKSTILDAICLALYGMTPRLGKVTKSTNEIMSRQTGECFAEVVFESSDGTYKCHWSQHRARKNADGKLAESKHEISDAINGDVLESKKREVAHVIEQKTGMDFERFTRSILLAQGGFDTFLKADSDHRAPILEQITGTEIYSEISKCVHERQRSEKAKLDLLQAETLGIILLSEEEENQVNNKLTEKNKLEGEVTAENKQFEKAILWLTGIDNLNAEINEISQAMDDLSIIIEDFKPEQEKLINAQKAADLDGVFATLKSLRKQQQTEYNSLEDFEVKQPDTDALLIEKDNNLKNSELLIEQAKNEKQASLATIQKVRLLDSQIKEKAKAKKTQKSENDKLKKQLDEQQKQINKAKAKLVSLLKEQVIVQEYLSTNSRDEVLITQMAGIEEQLNNLQLVYQQIETKNTALNSAKEQLIKKTNQLDNSSQELKVYQDKQTSAEKNRIQKQTDLNLFLNGQPLAQYRQKKDHLQEKRVLLSKIADMEADRKALEDGKDCPLCGSKDHPYAIGNVPEMGETEKQI
jgi:exonuclease SbcC